MPRRLKLETREKGLLEVYVVAEGPEGRWELGWENLRTTFFGRLIPRIPRSAFNHVLNGFSQPFIDALGLPPDGALQKMADPTCDKQRGCPLYDKRRCHLTSNKLPWCYEPAGFNDLGASTRRIAGELVFLWKEGVHVVAVYDD
jgi:hypothetical protein